MNEIKAQTNVDVEMQAKRIAVAIEAQGICLYGQAGKYKGSEEIVFDDPEVNVRITLKGQKNQTYSITIKINEVEKNIAGILGMDGINHVPKDYPLSDFNLELQ